MRRRWMILISEWEFSFVSFRKIYCPLSLLLFYFTSSIVTSLRFFLFLSFTIFTWWKDSPPPSFFSSTITHLSSVYTHIHLLTFTTNQFCVQNFHQYSKYNILNAFACLCYALYCFYEEKNLVWKINFYR